MSISTSIWAPSGNLDEARIMYEDALTKAATLSLEDGTSILAKEAYKKFLFRYPVCRQSVFLLDMAPLIVHMATDKHRCL